MTNNTQINNQEIIIIENEESKRIQIKDLLSGKTSVVFGLPGAFTPLCSAQHLPQYIAQAAAFKEQGVDQIICLTVNDPFVVQAWATQHNAGDKVIFICDFDASVTKGLDLDIDLSAHGLGIRSKRFTAIVRDAKIEALNIEESPGQCTISSAESALTLLSK